LSWCEKEENQGREKKVNYLAYKAGHLEKAMRGIASPLPPLRIHPVHRTGYSAGYS